jgi:hypothetical protein
MFQLAVNVLGTVTVALCALLLLRAYAKVRFRLLFWCGLCFAGLTAANALLVADTFIFPDVSLYRYRLGAAAMSMLFMIYGLIFESDPS